MSDTLAQTRERALGLLARREHSEKELRHKLSSRGLDDSDIEAALVSLKAEGLQSDMRFTDAFVHYRSNRGYGPRRIQQELKEKGISDELIHEFIDEKDPEWQESMLEVWRKKFASKPDDYKEQSRQSRFLQYRGFSGESIQRLFKQLKQDED